MRVLKLTALFFIVALGVAAIYFMGIYLNIWSQQYPAGTPVASSIPVEVVQDKQRRQSQSVQQIAPDADKQILFGDLHVHSTFSFDAFLWSLPMLGGQGPHSIADACDYARFCSALDFWSITDHAEASTKRRWSETIDSVRQCSALEEQQGASGLVSFLGFEWTQVGQVAEEHYGHKNVIFQGLKDEDILQRPIASTGVALQVLRDGQLPSSLMFMLDPENRGHYFNFRQFVSDTQSEPVCNENDNADVPCYVRAENPGKLANMLDHLADKSLIIPHGTSWGFYTPPDSALDKQLQPDMRPERQELIEVMSGHGNSEEYRPYHSVLSDGAGGYTCPASTADFTPMCQSVGEIIMRRCMNRDEPLAVCEERAEKARTDFLRMGMTGHRGLKGEKYTDYKDAGQCKDCFLPSFSHRPLGSVQYALAISNFTDPKNPRRFRFGFIASSDNHRSRPGTGYKPVARRVTTESSGAISPEVHDSLYPWQASETPSDQFEYTDPFKLPRDFGLAQTERQASFWTTGGLVAVHSPSRNRNDIWQAMKQRETYGTSGPRMLLWFDFLTNGDKVYPMGSELNLGSNPKFRVRALGAFEQKPGCPSHAHAALGERIHALCSGECYNPGDKRLAITHIDIIRIRPQKYAGEDVNQLIEDPWKRLECPADGNGCTVEFNDPDFAEYGRDTVYYARAVQEPTDTINGDNLRCTYDAEGNCIEINPCYGERYLVDDKNQCLSKVAHRAWSSPIFLNFSHGMFGASGVERQGLPKH